jgi:hypothetical protein
MHQRCAHRCMADDGSGYSLSVLFDGHPEVRGDGQALLARLAAPAYHGGGAPPAFRDTGGIIALWPTTSFLVEHVELPRRPKSSFGVPADYDVLDLA